MPTVDLARSGEIWKIALARPDHLRLEPAAFASAEAGFFVNVIRWTEAAEPSVLDADFEVDLGTTYLRGRILWNAPWTPDEDPFVPLSDEDWQNAWPGEVSIEGPALERLFDGSIRVEGAGAGTTFSALGAGATVVRLETTASPILTDGAGAVQTSAIPGSRMDSIRYSRDATRDPAAARAEVARDVALLSEEQPAAASTPSLRPGLAYSEPDPASTALRPQTEACSRSQDARRRPSGAPEAPSPGCVAEGARGENAAALEGSDRREGLLGSGEPDRAREVRDGSASLEQMLEECWLALRTIAERWLQAASAAAPEGRP